MKELILEPEKQYILFDELEKNTEGIPLVMFEDKKQNLSYYLRLIPVDEKNTKEKTFLSKNKNLYVLDTNKIYYVKTSDLELFPKQIDYLTFKDFDEDFKKHIVNMLMHNLKQKDFPMAIVKVFYWYHPKYRFVAFVDYLPAKLLKDILEIDSLEEANCYFREKTEKMELENKLSLDSLVKILEEEK